MDFLSVVGTRPQLIKLAPIVNAFSDVGLTHNFIDTGQHYDYSMSERVSAELMLPDPIVNLGIGSGLHGNQTAKMLEALEDKFISLAPNKILVYGDTNSTLAATLAASKLNISVAHIEAGLRSGNSKMPEEQNRIVADHLSDKLFAPTQNALRNLSLENLKHKSEFVGDVMYDLVLSRISSGLYRKEIKIKDFIVCTIHRAENTISKKRLQSIFNELQNVNLKIKVFAHPRLVNAITKFKINLSKNVEILEPISHDELLTIVYNSKAVITDSGGLQKESFFLNVPCITLRNETEWPETFLGNMNVLWNGDVSILDLLNRKVEQSMIKPFGLGNASKLIVESLTSI